MTALGIFEECYSASPQSELSPDFPHLSFLELIILAVAS